VEQGLGDTVPITGFLAAGMTFEKGSDCPYAERTEKRYLTQWVSLSSAADHRAQLLANGTRRPGRRTRQA
jgi:hypothetical protein